MLSRKAKLKTKRKKGGFRKRCKQADRGIRHVGKQVKPQAMWENVD